MDLDNILSSIFSSEGRVVELIEADSKVVPHDPYRFPKLSDEMARHIDTHLCWEEAVSITFLMVDKPNMAHLIANAIQTTQKNFVTAVDDKKIGIVETLVMSARKNSAVSWEMKLYQALLLVGRKRLVFDLGVKGEEEMTEALNGSHVKPSRRLLFQLAECLDSKNVTALAAILSKQSSYTGSLEVLFLSLIVAQNGSPTPEILCHKIEAALNQMKSMDLLLQFHELGAKICSCEIHARIETQQKENTLVGEFDESEYYPRGRGLCVIVNQKTFPEGLADRLGTDRDRDELELTFTLFQADVLKWDNLSAKDMLENLKLAKIRANNSTYNYQWLAVCVLSHGRRIANVDQIIGCDGQGVDRKQIINMFADASQCPNLHMKPKIFIFQACRGTESTVVQTPGQVSIPIEPSDEVSTDSGAVPINKQTGRPMLSDYVIASPTIEEFVAFRSTTDGSFYIRHLCKELQDKGHRQHVADILTMVNDKVMSYRPDYPSAPEYITTLSKKFQLQRTKESTEKGVWLSLKNRLFHQLVAEYVDARAGSV